MGNDESHVLREIALLVRHVPSAISSVVSVCPDQALAETQTLMNANEYSQLAVISDADRLVGAVSWRSIAQVRLSKNAITCTVAPTAEGRGCQVGSVRPFFALVGIAKAAIRKDGEVR